MQSLLPKLITDLVNIHTINSNIAVDLRYATTHNFTKHKIYQHTACYISNHVALKLNIIQKKLSQQNLGIKIWDAYRPLSVQKIFWQLIPDQRYVADPKTGSKHNRGSAVDLTLIDISTGKELEMPTPFDDFSIKAHRDYKNLPDNIIQNRNILENIMVEHGFEPLPTEWWHFDDQNWHYYPILDIPIEALALTTSHDI